MNDNILTKSKKRGFQIENGELIKYIKEYGVTEVVIPDGVTSIGNEAFRNCSIVKVTIPDGVTSIGSSAFADCKKLTEITIPNTVTSIGDNAFYGCKSLSEITLPDSLISIGDFTFCDCKNLTEITIPNNVTNIGGNAFGGCDNLTSVTYLGETFDPQQIDIDFDWSDVDFQCRKIMRRKLYGYTPNKVIKKLVIPDGVIVIGTFTFLIVKI